MSLYDFDGCQVEIDEEATRDYYSDSIEWDCTCGGCRNFVFLARDRQLPEDMLALLDKLGIPPEKATYAVMLYDIEEKLFYDITYRVAGHIVDEPKPQVIWLPEDNKRSIFDIRKREKTERKKMEIPVGKSGTLAGGTPVRCVKRGDCSSAEDFPEPYFDLTFALALTWKDGKPVGSNDIFISSDLEEDTSALEELLRKVIPTALWAEIHVGCEINVLLTDDAGIQAINLEQRGVDAPTDVLSFPMFDLKPGDKPTEADADPATHLVPLGDMVLNLDRVKSQAQEYGHSESRELAYLAVHSVLHLLGYDHLDEGPMKAQMRAREEAILAKLGLER